MIPAFHPRSRNPLASLRPALAAAILALLWTQPSHAATLGTPGATQVEYTLGENGTGWAANFQADATGNGRIMNGGGGPDNWLAGPIANGSTNSWMIADGKSAWIMSNASGMAANYQVTVFLSSADNWGPNATGQQFIFNMDGINFTRTGQTYTGTVNNTVVGSFTTSNNWENTGLMFQKMNDVFSFWISTNGGTTWTQYGSDLAGPGFGVDWSTTHLFVKPGGGSNYSGYADDFKVVSATLPVVGGDLTWNNGSGNFVWSTSAVNWTGSPWTNATLNNAIFGTTGAGAITLGEAIQVKNLTFNASGYTVTSNTLTLNSSVVTTNESAAISSNLTGDSLTKLGTGTLTLSGPDVIIGPTVVSGGTLVLNVPGGHISMVSATVEDAATLLLKQSSGTGAADPAWWSNSMGLITVNAGGTLEANNSPGNGINHGLALNGGSVTAVGVASEDWGHFTLNSNVTAGGNATSTISAMLAVNGNPAFNVADGSSLIVNGPLINRYQTSSGFTKTGPGTLALTGANTYTGTTTVSGGILSLGNGTANSNLSDSAVVSIALGAKINLNFTGGDRVGSLIIDGVNMGSGTFNATTHPDYFTGSGSLTVAYQSGTWTSAANGNWSTAANWQSNTIASGPDQTATFNGATGTTVTLDFNRSIGSLAFSGLDYSITGSSTLTFESSGTPAISVDTGRTATISTHVAGTLAAHKTGDGKLSLYAGPGDNYANAYNQTFGGMDIQAGTVELTSQFIKLGPVTIHSGATLLAAGFWATGASNPWFDGRSTGPITVNAGGTLAASQSMNAIVEGLTLLGGTVSSTAGPNGDWGDFIIASTVTADGSATSTISAELSLPGTRTFDVRAGSTLDISGAMHNRYGAAPGTLTKTGAGTLILAGQCSFTGNTYVGEGILEIGSTGSLRFDPAANHVTNSLSGAAGTSLNYDGNLYLNLAGAQLVTNNTWPVINLASFLPAIPTFGSNFKVTSNLGDFTESPSGSGVWKKTDGANNWTFTESTGDLTFSITVNDYESWAGPSGYNLSGGPDADDDHDGLTNHEEYAFGLVPNSGASVNPITVELDKTTGQFTYTRRDPDTKHNGLTYTVWTSVDLTEWNEDVGATNSQAPGATDGNGVQSVVVTLTGAPFDIPRLFVQIRAD